MNITDAAYATVHDFPGGATALGPRIGVSPQILNNKVNPNSKTHYLNIHEAEKIIGITGDIRTIEALAHEHSYLVYKVPETTECTDMSIGEKISKSLMSLGNYGKEIHEALLDGRIEQHELIRIEKSMNEHHTNNLKLLNRIKSMAEK